MFKALLLTAAALSLGVGLGALSRDGRSYVSGKFAFILDGSKNAGFLMSAEGGHATSDVIEERVSPDLVARKHISTLKYEDLTITMGPGDVRNDPLLGGWIAGTLANQGLRKNGSIIACDFNYKERSRRTFHEALISEVSFPSCDAVSKDPAYMVLKLAAQSVDLSLVPAGPVTFAPRQKKWLPSNFRLEIGGLDCSRVSKIDSFTIKQKVAPDGAGGVRRELRTSNLALEMDGPSADSFQGWYEDFVIKGNNGDAQEKTGTLHYLDADLKNVLLQVQLSGLGIVGASLGACEESSGARRMKFELYCESMKLPFPGIGG